MTWRVFSVWYDVDWFSFFTFLCVLKQYLWLQQCVTEAARAIGKCQKCIRNANCWSDSLLYFLNLLSAHLRLSLKCLFWNEVVWNYKQMISLLTKYLFPNTTWVTRRKQKDSPFAAFRMSTIDLAVEIVIGFNKPKTVFWGVPLLFSRGIASY